jgi:hypothetical protein
MYSILLGWHPVIYEQNQTGESIKTHVLDSESKLSDFKRTEVEDLYTA